MSVETNLNIKVLSLKKAIDRRNFIKKQLNELN